MLREGGMLDSLTLSMHEEVAVHDQPLRGYDEARELAPEGAAAAAWLGGLLFTSLIVGVSARELLPGAPPGTVRTAAAIAGMSVLALLAGRAASPRRCAAAAGASAGILVGLALALRTPLHWFYTDVAWHSAKVATVAAGHPFDDPILRIPTIYPFAFHLLLAGPVRLGVPLREVMWAVTPLTLAANLFAYWWLARRFLAAREAAWAAIAFPLFFYSLARGYFYLASPFNLSLVFVFAGLGSLVAGAASGSRPKLFAAGLLLGCAALIWYAHLLWIPLAVVVWGLRAGVRRAELVAAGGLLPAAVLAVHVAVLGGAGHISATAISAAVPTSTKYLMFMSNSDWY